MFKECIPSAHNPFLLKKFETQNLYSCFTNFSNFLCFPELSNVVKHLLLACLTRFIFVSRQKGGNFWKSGEAGDVTTYGQKPSKPKDPKSKVMLLTFII